MMRKDDQRHVFFSTECSWAWGGHDLRVLLRLHLLQSILLKVCILCKYAPHTRACASASATAPCATHFIQGMHLVQVCSIALYYISLYLGWSTQKSKYEYHIVGQLTSKYATCGMHLMVCTSHSCMCSCSCNCTLCNPFYSRYALTVDKMSWSKSNVAFKSISHLEPFTSAHLKLANNYFLYLQAFPGHW